MNLLDVVVLAAVAAGAFVGFRVGFVVRALSWLGLTIGLVVGLWLTPRLAAALTDSSPGVRLLSVASLLVGLALIGHTTGLVASQTLRRGYSRSDHVAPVDRITGGILGAAGALALLWLLVPALRSTPGWPAREARDSSLVAALDRYAPGQPTAARLLGRIVGEAPYPLFDDAHVDASPPTTDAGPRVDALGARSVVLVRGVACGLELSGTGFAVAPNLIATNAHVVAGEARPTVETVEGARRRAVVVRFDGRHDVAILRVDGPGLPPLPLGPTTLGTIASVLGHPHGGHLRATPARVARRIGTPRTDIYRSGTIRTSIVGLAAHLIVGDSGAPVVGADGRVQAMVFAVDPADREAAFALSSDELAPFVTGAAAEGGGARPVSTGGCLVD
jgi:S1-C subfamily serine protease